MEERERKRARVCQYRLLSKNYFIVFAVENLHYLYIENQKWTWIELNRDRQPQIPTWNEPWYCNAEASRIAYKFYKYIVASDFGQFSNPNQAQPMCSMCWNIVHIQRTFFFNYFSRFRWMNRNGCNSECGYWDWRNCAQFSTYIQIFGWCALSRSFYVCVCEKLLLSNIFILRPRIFFWEQSL